MRPLLDKVDNTFGGLITKANNSIVFWMREQNRRVFEVIEWDDLVFQFQDFLREDL